MPVCHSQDYVERSSRWNRGVADATAAPRCGVQRHKERFRRVVPAKTVAGCGAKAHDWSARAVAAARAQGRRFSREQCQMVHLSRWVRSPPTPGAARSSIGHSPQHSPASRRSKVDGRQPSAYFTAPNLHPLASALYYRWITYFVIYYFLRIYVRLILVKYLQ